MTLTLSNEEIEMFLTTVDTTKYLEEANGVLAAGNGGGRRQFKPKSINGVVPNVGQ